MIKKNVIASILMSLCMIILSSCSSNVAIENINNEEEIKVTEHNDEQAVSNNLNQTDSNEDIKESESDTFYPMEWYAQFEDYSVAPSELINKDMGRPDDNTEWLRNLSIIYPQIYGLDDYEKEKRINDMIYMKVISYHEILESRDYIDYNVEYRIMEINEKIISILFEGVVSDFRTSNRFSYAVTIDIDSEKELELKDFFIPNESFVQDALYTKFILVENNFNSIDENTPFVESFIESYLDISHTSDFYVEGNNVGIIIPTHNNMGYILIQGEVIE